MDPRKLPEEPPEDPQWAHVVLRNVESNPRCKENDKDLHFGIKFWSPLLPSHVHALLLYTDFSALCTDFSASFRAVERGESLEAIKARNARYHHFAKRLKELVVCYGSDNNALPTKNRSRGPFFCGVSAVLNIPQFAIRLNAPTSTSLHIEVAMRFVGGTDGMIIQLNNEEVDGQRAHFERHFACDWLSAFPEESERLFMGGRFQLKLETVRIVETKDNYRKFVRAFHLFDTMLSGQDMSGVTVTRADVRIVRGAVRGFLGESNGFHAFVNDTFRHFCARKTQIVLNLDRMSRMKNKDFVSLIMNELKGEDDFDGSEGDDVNLFQPVLFELFGNVKHVVVQAGSASYQFPFDLERLSQYAVPKSLRRMTITGKWLKEVSVDAINVGEWKVEVVEGYDGLDEKQQQFEFVR